MGINSKGDRQRASGVRQLAVGFTYMAQGAGQKKENFQLKIKIITND